MTDTPSEPCVRCGLPALGFAMISDDRLCHGDDERPSCYELEQWDRTVDGWKAAVAALPLPDLIASFGPVDDEGAERDGASF